MTSSSGASWRQSSVEVVSGRCPAPSEVRELVLVLCSRGKRSGRHGEKIGKGRISRGSSGASVGDEIIDEAPTAMRRSASFVR